MVEEIKKRRISSKDWNAVASYIKSELKNRQDNRFRKRHEAIWKEVDRQVAMESMSRVKNDPTREGDWRSALELGELSRASEILSADIRRMSFPQNRYWFEPHNELDLELNPNTGDPIPDPIRQKRIDGQLRALMTQQHIDFGLKGRTDLSVKEALHHGSYVVEVRMESLLRVHDGMKVEPVRAPVWVPHSMWNCYPESSASILGTNAFYNGSMIIKSYMPYLTVKKQKGWMNISKVKDPGKNKDCEIFNFFGDIAIPRSDGDIYLPNCKVSVIGDTVVYYEQNPLPYSQIIYNGYERLDVRDPYYVSPLIKMAPTQKIASVLANKYLDNVDLKVEPPTVYDGNDPALVQSGGPIISPGSSTPTKNMANFKVIDVGDPSYALQGLQFMMTELQKGTSVDSVRSGMSAAVEQTATEVERVRQGGQIRTVDFIDKHELHGLRPFLYLQHEYNKRNLKNYQFYNPEIDAPDFERMNKSDLLNNVHFEVTGSKGLIEEEQRQQQTMVWTQFLMSSPLTAELVNVTEIAKEGYRDAGHKDPERFLNLPDETTAQQQVIQLQAQNQQLQEGVKQLQQALQEIQGQLQQAESKQQTDMMQMQMKASSDADKFELEQRKHNDEMQFKREALQLELELKARIADEQNALKEQQMMNDKEISMFTIFMSKKTCEEDSERESMQEEYKEAKDEFSNMGTEEDL